MSAPASWAKWLETKEKSAAGGAHPAFLEQQFLRLGRRFLSLALWEPGAPAAAATTTTSAGRVCLGAGWWTTQGKGERRNISPPLSFPALRALAAGFFLRFWSHQCSLLLGQFEFSPVDAEEEKRSGSEYWFNGPSKSCPPPQSIHHYWLVRISHPCFRPCVHDP